MALTLYHYWRSSCSWRVRWALALKGVSYDAVPINLLKGEQAADSYLKQNPSGFVPALAIDGRFFGESMALCEWIDETWPEPALLPRAPKTRLIVRQLALTMVAGTQPLQNPAVLKHFVPDEKERSGHARHWIQRGLAVYEKLLETNGRDAPSGLYSVGDQVTLADVCLIPQVYNAMRFDVDVAATPRIKAIYDRCLATEACAASSPPRQPGAT